MTFNRKSNFAGHEISGYSAYRGHLQTEGGAAKEIEEDHSSMVSKVDFKKGESPVYRQFHQHFTYKFFIQTSFWQLFSSYMYIEKAAKTTLYEIFVHKMLMKLTPRGKQARLTIEKIMGSNLVSSNTRCRWCQAEKYAGVNYCTQS